MKVCAWLVLSWLCLATAAHAEPLPLWEAGAGAAALSFPKYRGSNERDSWLLPFPYFIYRGDVLRVDERRMRGLVYESERADLDFSFTGTVPVKSGDGARRGMPDLDATLEVGPSLNLKLAGGPAQKSELQLRLAARAVIASDFTHVARAGWVFQPSLAYDVRDVLGATGWKLGLLGGLTAGDRVYHRYFYGVDAAYATPQRPAYEARGGYGGMQVTAALSKRYPRYWVGGFARWDKLDGATFADSPLTTARQTFTAGIAFSWVLRQSGVKVDPKN